ncbi:F-box protein FBW2-like [Nicotiana tabacum]|uniref:F-box protein FBW2-like n=2 Tax=Nicotiana tabacum TaxID=4097 RepID=A0A1S3YBJ5_TOBAC|nr:PREDICTED: F-box protein FBW2-like [Nicotiana tabacum]XP_016449352.1 PREDICTED: F-box protein FBW2-like [Nicotiana tabacum]XP_016449360.1 PREDICTED: F-box protein FBW2-like [Nicotiana tabacum]XP_016449369.1 PREDICTED: F-box protein FBW2-like [Nicotiana tabacum]XP_016449376.1 PREDICTED: F-box protein FBW2-like [Nicotiana tabacum]XP_016449383.1 PREDICTED: F-box protein FBW2-like [Nicotiana tabacum]XP_016449390.1 PREDICTED: F-box protein FBW2-like [Nicotiana tabacum]XP_016449398.1 PREDICTED:
MENQEFRRWDELIPDALGMIFRNLSLQDVLTIVPRVCKSWRKAAIGPYCWQEIDIEEWSKNCCPDNLDRMLQLLITRSCGSLRKLCVSGLSREPSFTFIANNAKSLQMLRLPKSDIGDSAVEQVAGMFSNITFLDVSYCIKIGARALGAIGKHCRCLTGLRRTMHPLEVIDKLSQDDEALAIARTMPKLKQLEIAYMLVGTTSITEVLKNCGHLELLDVRGCWNVNLDENFVKKFHQLKVVGPLVVDCYDRNGWDNCSDYSSSSGYVPWDFVAGDMDDDDFDEMSDVYWEEDDQSIEDVEMWFYDDLNAVDSGYDWPQSP